MRDCNWLYYYYYTLLRCLVSSVSRVDTCQVFTRTVRYFGSLSGIEMIEMSDNACVNSSIFCYTDTASVWYFEKSHLATISVSLLLNIINTAVNSQTLVHRQWCCRHIQINKKQTQIFVNDFCVKHNKCFKCFSAFTLATIGKLTSTLL